GGPATLYGSRVETAPFPSPTYNPPGGLWQGPVGGRQSSAEAGILSNEHPESDVNPLTTRLFALPERLTPKSDPTLIGHDEQHFAAIEASLADSIAELSARLAATLKQEGGVDQ